PAQRALRSPLASAMRRSAPARRVPCGGTAVPCGRCSTATGRTLEHRTSCTSFKLECAPVGCQRGVASPCAKPPPRRGRPSHDDEVPMQLRRHDVLSGAIAILDEYGLGDLTMRRLGAALGVQAGALYWHFP